VSAGLHFTLLTYLHEGKSIQPVRVCAIYPQTFSSGTSGKRKPKRNHGTRGKQLLKWRLYLCMLHALLDVQRTTGRLIGHLVGDPKLASYPHDLGGDDWCRISVRMDAFPDANQGNYSLHLALLQLFLTPKEGMLNLHTHMHTYIYHVRNSRAERPESEVQAVTKWQRNSTLLLLLLLFFIPHVAKIPWVKNKKLKASWNGYVSIPSSAGKVSWKRIALNRCIGTLIRWNKNWPSSGSPECSEIFRPRSERKQTVASSIGRCVSTATGWNSYYYYY